MSKTILHLIYVHGFQGNDTTFQSFPTDLHHYLSPRLPQHLELQSSLYPTYKSVKPISFATKNFLEWLSTQPPGPVILLGHSMGGLLVADAATSPSNSYRSRRIIGVIAFDTPYLGMHPHVVISGIASLFPKDANEDKEGSAKKPTDKDMNDEKYVNIVDDNVTDDWEAFKASSSRPRLHSLHSSHSSSKVGSPGPLSSPSPSPSLSPPASSYSSSPPPFVDRTLALFASHADDPFVRWMKKHADDPLGASKKWVVEHFQFGACMFDPAGLKERYSKLVDWNGLWVNYWTETVPKAEKVGDTRSIEEAVATADNDLALLETGIPGINLDSETSAEPQSPEDAEPPSFGPRTKSETKIARAAAEKSEKARNKEVRNAEKERAKALKQIKKHHNKMRSARHFIVLPTGLGSVLGGGDKWEMVPIGGVDDEVAAHCGLFIRGQNLDYDGFVARVANTVSGWSKRL